GMQRLPLPLRERAGERGTTPTSRSRQDATLRSGGEPLSSSATLADAREAPLSPPQGGRGSPPSATPNPVKPLVSDSRMERDGQGSRRARRRSSGGRLTCIRAVA